MNAPLRAARGSSTWPRVRLGELAEHRLGKMLDKAKNTGVPRHYLRNPNVRWFDFDLADLQEILVEEKDVHKYELRYGDVIICEGGEAGRAALWKNEAEGIIFQKACHRVRVGPRLDACFLIHHLMYDYFNGGLDDYYTGATIKHFTGQDLARYEVLLPPLDEQRRIAAILNKAGALRRTHARITQLVNSLSQSVFEDMFGGGRHLWDHVLLESAVEEFRYGTSNKSSQAGFPVLRIPNVIGGRIDLAELKTVPLEEKEFKRLQMRQGDLLLVRTNGNPEYVGRCAVFDGGTMAASPFSASDFVYASYLIRARLSEKKFSPYFVQAFLSSAQGRQAMMERAKTSAGQFNINTKGLGSIRIPAPPRELQDAFERKLKALQSMFAEQAEAAIRTEALFVALQHRAFSDQL